MGWFFTLIESFIALFTWGPVEDYETIENHIWLHNREKARHVEVIRIESPTISGGAHKK